MLSDLLRAVVIATLATLAARWVLRGSWRSTPWILAGWWCTPPLLTAYAWSLLPGLVGWWPHVVHAGLAGLRLVPVAACVAWAVAPAPLTPAGTHAARLAGLSRWRRWWWQLRSGDARRWWVAGLVTTVGAWGEFECASRLAVPAWAVRLFDAQAGGAEVVHTAVAAGPGVAVQGCLLVVVAWLVRGAGPVQTSPPVSRPLGMMVLGCGSIALVLGPLAIVLADASRDWAGVFRHFGLGRELVSTGLYAATAAVAAWGVSGLLGRWAWPVAACGLAGSLAIGLAVATVLQVPGLDRLSGTPVPLVVALLIVLMPAAVVGRRLIAAAVSANARQCATVLSAGDSIQRGHAGYLQALLVGRLTVRVVLALGLIAASDCAAAAILAPADMGTVTPLLYNFMHYGRSPALSGRLLAAVAIPVLVVAVVECSLAGWMRWRRG